MHQSLVGQSSKYLMTLKNSIDIKQHNFIQKQQCLKKNKDNKYRGQSTRPTRSIYQTYRMIIIAIITRLCRGL